MSQIPNLGTTYTNPLNTLRAWETNNNINTQYYGNALSKNNPNLQPSTSTGFNWGNLGNTIGAVSGGLNAIGGLANAYLGYQNYKMAKEQFGVERDFANRNLANSATLTNNAIDSAANLAYHLGGKSLTNPSSNTATRNAYMTEANTRKVDGSAI